MDFLKSFIGRLTGSGGIFKTLYIEPDQFTFSHKSNTLAVHTSEPSPGITLIRLTNGTVFEVLADVPRFDRRRGESLKFSPDGQLLICCGKANETHVMRAWDTQTWKRLVDVPFKYITCPLDFTPDGALLLAIGESSGSSAVDGHISLLAINGKTISANHEVAGRLRLGGAPTAIAFGPDNARLFAYGKNFISVWKLKGNSSLVQEKEEYVNDDLTQFAVSSDGKTLLTKGGTKIYLWDSHSLKIKREVEVPSLPGTSISNFCHSAHLSPDGRTIIAAAYLGATPPKDRLGKSAVYFYDADSGQVLHKIEGLVAGCESALSPDGRTIALARLAHGKPSTIELRHAPPFVK